MFNIKRVAVFLVFVLMVLLNITGCVDESLSVEEDQARTLEIISSLSSRIKQLEANQENFQNLIDEQITILTGDFDENAYDILPLYHLDAVTYELRKQYYIMIPNKLPLDKKIDLFAAKLSAYSFNGKPMEFTGIEMTNQGGKIAIINLVEAGDDFGETWKDDFLQDGDLSLQTARKLIITFLQESFEGEWIDGVKFLYNHDMENIFPNLELGVIYSSVIH